MIETFFTRYSGREKELYEFLCQKYNVQPKHPRANMQIPETVQIA